MQFLLNIAVAAAALVVIFGVWGGVHLLARKRMGERQLGCKGPVPDPGGNMLCCKGGGKLCESADGHEHGREGGAAGR